MEWGCQGLEGGVNRGLVFRRCRVFVWENDKALEMEDGDGCTTNVNVLNAT